MENGMQLSELICKTLLRELTEGAYRETAKLPPEREIALQLGVSRTALRDALASLEREGFISRKHGIGTLVNRHVLEVKTRMDLEEEFLAMVRKAGKDPGVAFCRHSVEEADSDTAKALQIAPESPVIRIDRLVTADGEPAIYCIDRLPLSLVRTRDYDPRVLSEPVFTFLSRYCDTEVFMDLTEVRAVAATEEQAALFHLPPAAPLLHMNEVGYSFQGTPVLSSLEYYRDQVLHHTVLRKKI